MLSPVPKIITISSSDSLFQNCTKKIPNHSNKFTTYELLKKTDFSVPKANYNNSQIENANNSSSIGILNANIKTDISINDFLRTEFKSKNDNLLISMNLLKYSTNLSVPFFHVLPNSNANYFSLINNNDKIQNGPKEENIRSNAFKEKNSNEFHKKDSLRKNKNSLKEISLLKLKFEEENPPKGSLINDLYNFKAFDHKEINAIPSIKFLKKRSSFVNREEPIKIKLNGKKCKSPAQILSKEKIKYFHNIRFQTPIGDKESDNIDSFSEEDDIEYYENGYNHMPNTFSEMLHIFKREVEYDQTQQNDTLNNSLIKSENSKNNSPHIYNNELQKENKIEEIPPGNFYSFGEI